MKKSIIAVLSVLLLVTLAAVFTSCGVKADPRYNYRVTGAFADWGPHYEAKFMMTQVAASDKRLAPIKSELKNAQYIYVYEYTPDRDNPAGWYIEYTGAGIRVDGIQGIKFIRLSANPSEPSGWAHDAWMPSTEMRGFRSITPDTIYVAPDRTDEARDAAGDGLGSVNDNPALLKGARPYLVVLAIYKDGSKGIGAVLL